jgi:hypothetical protein
MLVNQGRGWVIGWPAQTRQQRLSNVGNLEISVGKLGWVIGWPIQTWLQKSGN